MRVLVELITMVSLWQVHWPPVPVLVSSPLLLLLRFRLLLRFLLLDLRLRLRLRKRHLWSACWRVAPLQVRVPVPAVPARDTMRAQLLRPPPRLLRNTAAAAALQRVTGRANACWHTRGAP
jgi:hypothetical protein